MDIITYAILKGKCQNSTSNISSESISVNNRGELLLNKNIPLIQIDMDTGYLITDSNVFTVDEHGFLYNQS